MEQTLPLLIGLLVPLGLFAMIGWVVYVVVEGGRRRHLQTMEFHARILERMGSAREFGEFLGTEAGSRFLDAVSPQQQPAARIARFVQVGIVAVAVGLGLLAAGRHPDRLGNRHVGVGRDLVSAPARPATRQRAAVSGEATFARPVGSQGSGEHAMDPMQLWWKAQLLRRWDAERRAAVPLDVMDVVQIAGAAAAAGLLVVWSLPVVLRVFAS